MSKFSKGDRIGFVDGKLRYDEYGDSGPYYGTVTDELSDGRVMVKWDDKWMNNAHNANPRNPEKLVPEKDLQEKYSALETEFKRVEAEVQAKMEEASRLITDAQKFAKDAGFDLQEMRDATSTLESAMGSAGWNTSSWHC